MILLLYAFILCVHVGRTVGKHGTLIAVGGDLTSDKLYKYIISTCKASSSNGHKGGESTLLITTAASFPYSWDCEKYPTKCNDPTESNSKMNALYYEKKFNALGLQTAWIPCDVSNTTAAHAAEWVNRINKNDFCGVFFSGGNQMRYISTYRGTPVIEAILDKYKNDGLMIAGSSAGTAIQTGKDMITGGVSWYALRYKPYPNENRTDYDLTYDTIGGWDTFPQGILDTHFGQRGRQGRLAMAAYKTYRNFGFGVDQDTAWVYDGSNIAHVIGDTGVTIIDTTYSSGIYGPQDSYGLKNITLHYLTDGDSWDIMQKKPIWAADKTNILHKEQNEYAKSTNDVFSWNQPMAFIDMAASMVNSHKSNSICGESYHDSPVYNGCCYLTKDLVGYYRDLGDGKRLISWHGMRVEFIPK